jgi:hypothetical protein
LQPITADTLSADERQPFSPPSSHYADIYAATCRHAAARYC